MYLPRHFASDDLAVIDALADGYPLATLITLADGGPFASHIPVLCRREEANVLVEGHWARANPQWRHGERALLILHGPDAYVSPGWYPDKASAARVPTWNYVVVHLSGTLEIFDDESALGDLVERLSRRFEAGVGGHWAFEPGRRDHARQLRGIVGFRLRPDRIEIKRKLNQNHPPANVRGVVEGLETAGGERNRMMAAWMREALANRTTGETS